MIFGSGERKKERQDRIGFPADRGQVQAQRLKTTSPDEIQKHRPKNGLVSTRILAGILTAVFAAAIGFYVRFSWFQVQSVQVYGHESINADELIYYTGMKNQPICLVKVHEIEENVFRRYPENRAITVRALLPNKLEVFFEQRTAAVEWNFGGSKFWIDDQGYVFYENASGSPEIVVFANSFPGALNRNDRTIPSKFRSEIVESIRHIYNVKPPGARLNFTYDNGYGWDSGKGYELWIGVNDRELDEKMAMAENLDRYFKENEIEPAMLSLEFTKAPYFRYAD